MELTSQDQKLLERQNQDKEKPKGLLQRSVESLSLNSDVSFNTQDYLRQLESGDSLAEIIQFEEGDKRRSRARTGTRYNFRTAVDPGLGLLSVAIIHTAIAL